MVRHHPRKRFGQNFLQNKQIINNILQAMQLQPEDKLIEIGPGLGALTQPLLKRLNHLHAVEIDTDLQAYLLTLPTATEKLNLITADALSVDYSQWGNELRIVGNLPYNISTAIILHLLHHIHYISDMHFMLQKEVVERLVALPGSKAYGRLSVIVQYHCAVEYLFDVSPDAFYPQPKVDSAVVRLIPHAILPYAVDNIAVLERLVALAFAMRRKTLANNLKLVLSAHQLMDLGINPSLRPEQISVQEYVQIAGTINLFKD